MVWARPTNCGPYGRPTSIGSWLGRGVTLITTADLTLSVWSPTLVSGGLASQMGHNSPISCGGPGPQPSLGLIFLARHFDHCRVVVATNCGLHLQPGRA